MPDAAVVGTGGPGGDAGCTGERSPVLGRERELKNWIRSTGGLES